MQRSIQSQRIQSSPTREEMQEIDEAKGEMHEELVIDDGRC